MDEYYYERNQFPFYGGGFSGVPFGGGGGQARPPAVRFPQPVHVMVPGYTQPSPAQAALPPPPMMPPPGYPPPGYPPPGYPPPGYPPPGAPPGAPPWMGPWGGPCGGGILGGIFGNKRFLPILVDNVLKGWAAFSGTPQLPTGNQLEDIKNVFTYLDTAAQYLKSDEQKRFFGGLARDIL
jgi:hypothetical protein